jgi:hypothetical protein
MSRGWFLKSCRDYSTKFNGRLRAVRVNFVRTHHVRRIKAYDRSSRRFFFPESCVRQFAETSGKDTFTAWACGQVGIKVEPAGYGYREASAGNKDGAERKVTEAYFHLTSGGSDEGE